MQVLIFQNVLLLWRLNKCILTPMIYPDVHIYTCIENRSAEGNRLKMTRRMTLWIVQLKCTNNYEKCKQKHSCFEFNWLFFGDFSLRYLIGSVRYSQISKTNKIYCVSGYTVWCPGSIACINFISMDFVWISLFRIRCVMHKECLNKFTRMWFICSDILMIWLSAVCTLNTHQFLARTWLKLDFIICSWFRGNNILSATTMLFVSYVIFIQMRRIRHKTEQTGN